MTINVDGKDYRAITIFHPSYLLRNHSLDEGSPRRLMKQDLANIKNEILPDVDHSQDDNQVEYMNTSREIAMVQFVSYANRKELFEQFLFLFVN